MAMKRTPIVLLGTVLLTTMTLQVRAQSSTSDAEKSWLASVSRYAKWGFLGAAVGLTATAAIKRSQADDRFEDLEMFCDAAVGICASGPDGAFLDATAEGLFQQVKSLDRRAQGFLIGGQIALGVSGVMFLIDLLSGDPSPENIPFTPLRFYQDGNRVGLQLNY